MRLRACVVLSFILVGCGGEDGSSPLDGDASLETSQTDDSGGEGGDEAAADAPEEAAADAPAESAPPVDTGATPLDCEPLKFPLVELVPKKDAATEATYAALKITSCPVPKCFIDVEDLRSPDGTVHDVHVKLSDNFELYEIIATEIDPDGTGKLDKAHAYSTHVLVDPSFITHLQKLRDVYGGPVDITSGFRSPKHQHAVCQSICGKDSCTDSSGTVTCAYNSRHMWGAAADMDLKYESAADKSGFGFVFHENGGTGPHLHVDMRSCN
ncbi:MAG: hypothetical protein ACXWP4_15705 [Polyangiales bacterium]